MKISFDKIPGLSNLPKPLRDKPKLVFLIILCLGGAIAFLAFSGTKETQKIKQTLKIPQTQKSADTNPDKDVGVLNDSIDTKSYVSRLEKDYFALSAKQESADLDMAALKKEIEELRKSQGEVSRILMDIDKRAADARKEEQASAISGSKQFLKPSLNLEMAKVAEIVNKPDSSRQKYVYLPLGSFVKCTLLTGVYAPSDQSNPLPVLISIDEAFYGPNNSRIPLKGAFAVGKAVGDAVSRRAVIQIVSFSTMLPGGRVFEHEANLGYLADNDGQLGVPGALIYNTGRQLGLNFLAGFLSGGSEALSQAETSTVTGAYGQTMRNVTGDTSRYAMFSGLANSAQGAANYYQKQLEALIPAVRIEPGRKVILVVQKGVQIEGLEVTGDSFGYIDD